MTHPSSWLSLRVFTVSLAGWGCFWTALGLLGLIGVHVDGEPLPFLSREVILHLVSWTVPFGIATPFLLQLGERFAAARPSRVQLCRRLALWAVAFSTLHALCTLAALGWHEGSWRVPVMGVFSFGVPYAGIGALAVAIGQRRVADEDRRAFVEAQLRALRSQLQPHFLFNTLQGIAATTRQDPDVAVRMIALLGDLLRQTLRERDGRLVTLAEERELLAPYLELQRLRFADRLTIELDLPDDVLAAEVPDLLLQPLVENALLHGIERRPGAGTVVIRARRDGERLELEVADDGAGPGAAEGDGVGLGNTRERLAALFGTDAALELRPAGVRGTVARVRLPWREARRAA